MSLTHDLYMGRDEAVEIVDRLELARNEIKKALKLGARRPSSIVGIGQSLMSPDESAALAEILMSLDIFLSTTCQEYYSN